MEQTVRFTPVNWVPMTLVVPFDNWKQMMYMGCTGDGPSIYLYKHINTRQHINIDESGQCYNWSESGYLPITRREALENLIV